MGWDDYVMISAMTLSIVAEVVVVVEVHFGAGRHKQYIDPSDYANGYKLNFVTQFIHLFAISLVKVSVGFFLLRIAVSCIYRRIIISVMGFLLVYTIGSFFTIVLQCTNVAVLWDPTVTATCWSPHTIRALSYVNVSLNIVTDLLFSFAIPIPLLWSLRMNKRQRLSLIGVFGLGIFATGAAVARMSFLSSYANSTDWLWDSRTLTVWSVIESNIGIIAASLPCLKPLFRAFLGGTYGRGTHDATAAAYSHTSRPFDAGTGRQSVNGKGWATLGSSRTAKHDGHRATDFPRSYATKESFHLTTINADRDVTPTEASPVASTDGGESTRKSSQESLARMGGMSGMGGIKVDTEVNVESCSMSNVAFVDVERRERRDLV
ncbi:hypothetical protein N0V95_003837 [Ascochyta clinopodiicola]|nr:hypothetical protein N0V95_003837 [Ascochyta clinopodiicola]